MNNFHMFLVVMILKDSTVVIPYKKNVSFVYAQYACIVFFAKSKQSTSFFWRTD